MAMRCRWPPLSCTPLSPHSCKLRCSGWCCVKLMRRVACHELMTESVIQSFLQEPCSARSQAGGALDHSVRLHKAWPGLGAVCAGQSTLNGSAGSRVFTMATSIHRYTAGRVPAATSLCADLAAADTHEPALPLRADQTVQTPSTLRIAAEGSNERCPKGNSFLAAGGPLLTSSTAGTWLYHRVLMTRPELHCQVPAAAFLTHHA